jgi:RNA polymerase sigma factor (sigma-70 family)
MANGYLHSILGHLRGLAGTPPADGPSDEYLLERFVSSQDEVAFAALLERHGPAVLGVCRRLLANRADADDAFQATFLVLVSRPRAIRRRGSVGSWLYGVAYRIAHRARQRDGRRRHLGLPDAELPDLAGEEPAAVLARRELRAAVDEELLRLPQKYQAPVVLCYLQGRTNTEAAAQLGWPVGTVQTRLFRARELLRARLTRRGLALSVAVLTEALAPPANAAVPAALTAATLRAAALFAAGVDATTLAPQVVALTKGSLRAMFVTKLQKVAAALLVLAVLGVAAGLSAQHVVSQRQAAANEDGLALAAGAPAAPDAPAEKPDRPQVVKVFPADGATDVEPITEIRIRFDRAMDPACAYLAWTNRGHAGFRPRGEVRYVKTAHEFVVPVQLSPGCKHEITLNQEAPTSGKVKEYEGFQSDKRVAAKPYRWSFETAKPAGRPGDGPRATVTPPSDTEVALLTPLEVTFDQPMDPQFYGLAVPDSVGQDRRPQLLGQPTYDADRHRFSLLVGLPPNWSGQLRLEGFRSKEGALAAPVELKYRTLRTILGDKEQERIAEAGRAANLRRIIERTRKARRDLKGFSEEAVWTMRYGLLSLDWYQLFQTRGSRFRVQGGDKFLGVIDDVMHLPFRIGSDGKTCWWRHGNEVVSLPAGDIAEKDVLVGDAFHAAGPLDTDGLIRDRKLEYRGEATVRRQHCWRVRSWAVDFYHNIDWLTPVRDWYIDAETFLPVRVEMLSWWPPSWQTIDYTHARVNEPIPDEEFRPQSGAGTKAVDAEPLRKGFTRRFLSVIDGSNGRMSVRWGMKGPAGSSSSGLN